MPIPKNKQELLDTLKINYEKLKSELIKIPENKVREKTLEGNLSVCDLIAYQIGWEKLLLSWYETGKKDQIPMMPKKSYKWNELGKLALCFYAEYQHHTIYQLMTTFEKIFQKILHLVENETNASLYTIGIYNWTGDKWPLGRWINVNTSSPYN
ncbi:MAG: hypothetical protein K940chlam8_01075 [Chlamydiae bacterium]|nr:hypothetical protein [Chlamydiota bacterium]